MKPLTPLRGVAADVFLYDAKPADHAGVEANATNRAIA